MTRAIQIPGPLAIGDEVGQLRITAIQPDRLVLSVPQGIPVLLLVLGIAAAAAGIQSSLHGPNVLTGWLFIFAIAFLSMSVTRLGLSYTFDGSARCVVKRRLVPVSTCPVGDLRAVSLAVDHQGSNETLRLGLVKAYARFIDVTLSPTTECGHSVSAAGEAISSILDIPLLRSGKLAAGR